MIKKILFLGGAFSQLPAIKYAKDMGFYVVTADYLPKNPGHKISDEYYNISTIDKNKILKLAQKINIDAVSAYASDPAAPTAAYISEKMGLVGSSYQSVDILSNKNLFRKFLSENSYQVPWFFCSKNVSYLLKKYPGGKAIIKPVDSSGSKGVFVVNNEKDIIKKFDKSKHFSRRNTVILEKYIDKKGPQIHGEGFVQNGKVVLLELGDQVFSKVNGNIPYSTTIPSFDHIDIMPRVYRIIKKIIKEVGFKNGGINVEVIRDLNDDIYVLEIGARSGGNFMPQLTFYKTGFDLVKANIDVLFKNKIKFDENSIKEGYFAQIILHSSKNGIFQKVNIPEIFKNCVKEKVLFYKKGDLVKKYNSSRDVVGVLILHLKGNKGLKVFRELLYQHNWVVVT